MPRFFFDLIAQDRVVIDEFGVDVPDAETAMHGCISGVKDMLESGDLDGKPGDQVVMKDANGRILMSISLEALLPMQL